MPRRTLAAQRRLGTFDILTDCFLYTNDIQFFSVPSKRDVGFKYTGFSLCLSLFCRLIKIIPALPPPLIVLEPADLSDANVKHSEFISDVENVFHLLELIMYCQLGTYLLLPRFYQPR